MNKYVSRGMWFTLCVGGLWLAGTAAANAAEAPSDGVASGDQAVVGVTVPVSIAGNGISVLGDSTSTGSTAAAPAAPTAPSVSISPDAIGGVLSGDQAAASVSVPVTVAGNAVSVLGDTTSSGSESTAAPAASDPAASATSAGADGVASGIQAPVAVDVPVTAGGNAISVLGDAASTGSSATAPAAGSASSATASGSGSGGGLLSDIQAPIAAAVPVTAGGNAISVIGDSQTSGSETTAPAAGTGSTATSGSGSDGGLLSGVQAPIDAAVPVTAGGNAVSVVGDSTTSGSDTAAPAAGNGSTATSGSGSDGGLLSGVQAPIDAAVPVTAGGNAISVVGDSTSTESSASAPATGGGSADGGSTDGGIGVGGIDLPVGVDVPVTVGGNAISVVGDSTTTGSTTTPTTPTGPTDPTTPTTPTTPTGGTGAGTVTASVGGAMSLAAGSGSGAAALASTGSDELGLGAVGALLALLGVMLAFVSATRTRRHHTR